MGFPGFCQDIPVAHVRPCLSTVIRCYCPFHYFPHICSKGVGSTSTMAHEEAAEEQRKNARQIQTMMKENVTRDREMVSCEVVYQSEPSSAFCSVRQVTLSLKSLSFLVLR